MRHLLFIWGLIVFSAPLMAEGYRFSHDGSPVFPKIYPVEGQRMGLPEEGDLAVVSEFAFVLGAPGHYQLRFDSPLATRLFCRIDGGPERCIAVRTVFGTAGSQRVLHNPLLEMSEDEKGSLRGVRLDVDPQQWKPSLAGIEWGQCVLELRNIDYPLGNLPDSLRYLRLAPTQPVEDHGFARLKILEALRYAYVQLSHGKFPLSALTGSRRSLINLEIDGTSIEDLGSLAELGALRFLKLRRVAGLDSLAWAAGLEGLRVLKVDHSEISDLQPIVKLPNLRLLSVNDTKVASLPAPGAFPVLIDFRLHSTPAAEDKALLAPYRPAMNVSVKDWEESIGKFSWQDYKFRTRDAVLFVGSSSIRGWDLDKAFPEWNTRNRGFGGSELSDALIHYDKIVLPNLPRAIVIYAGDNDIANGETAEQVVADWKKFVGRTAKKLPRHRSPFCRSSRVSSDGNSGRR